MEKYITQLTLSKIMITETIESRKLGKYEAVKLINKKLGNALEVIPELGGRLNGLWLSDDSSQRNVIDGFSTEEDLVNDTFYHNVLLFPFVNRLENGAYTYNDSKYNFPINEPATGNALHGFIFDKSLKIEETQITDKETSIHLKYTYNKEFEYYPFNADVDVYYRLTASNQMQFEIQVKNTGDESLPFATGWHPYFTFNRNVDDVTLTLPACELIMVNSNLIPTGSVEKDERFLNGKQIQSDKLDNSFRLNPESDDHIVVLESEQDKCKITIQMNGSIKYTHVFVPPDRQSIAVEPVTSNVNAFRTGDDLIHLEPGKSFHTTVQVTLTQTN